MRKPIISTLASLLLIGVIFLAGNGRIVGTAGPVTDDQAAKYAGRRTVVHGNRGGNAASWRNYSKVFRSIPVAEEEGSFGEYWVTGRVEIVDGRAIVRVTNGTRSLAIHSCLKMTDEKEELKAQVFSLYRLASGRIRLRYRSFWFRRGFLSEVQYYQENRKNPDQNRRNHESLPFPRRCNPFPNVSECCYGKNRLFIAQCSITRIIIG